MLGHSRKLYAAFAFVLVAAVGAGCSKEAAKSNTDTAPPPSAAKTPEAAKPAEVAKPAEAEGKPRVEGQGFVVEVKSPAGAAPGAEGVAQVVLNATGAYHLNKDYPTALEITAPDGVTLVSAKLTTADASKFEEKTATWDVKFTSKDAGEKKFGAKFKFAVCTETTCDPKREALAWTVPVK